jgi:TRAP-type mannitol/chloroaromatic compound transport system substrate-binding protein
MAFGLHEVAPFYYYPGWHEPSGVLEALVSTAAFDALSPHLQAVIDAACRAEAQYVVAEFAARNQQALGTLTSEHGVQLKRFPDAVLASLHGHTRQVMRDLAAGDADLGRVHASYRAYADAIAAWHGIAEGAHPGIRTL